MCLYNILRKTDLCPLTNPMTEFTPVVVVVDFYWQVTITECLREGHFANNDFKEYFVQGLNLLNRLKSWLKLWYEIRSKAL